MQIATRTDRLHGIGGSVVVLCLGALQAVFVLLVLCRPGYGSAAESPEIWEGIRSGGHVVLLRHALAPGFGDPPEFVIGDCATQRNLSEGGRRQARRIGALFREHGIVAARVFSSQWCRCLETARLLELGPVREFPVLNSLHGKSRERVPRSRELRDWLDAQSLESPLVLVTHQANISAFTGQYPGSGELVVVRREKDGGLAVVGTLPTD